MGTGTQAMSEFARLAVLIPCYNEEAGIAKVIGDFKAALPRADIYVYDNNSTDRTVEVARAVGAIVRNESRQGKGNVVRRMFADVEADIYILVDGDDTYDATTAPLFIRKLVDGGLYMVSGRRIAVVNAAYRFGHMLGNRLLTDLTVMMFRVNLVDLLTGYRVMSRRFVKSFPFTAEGFSIETELTVHAVRLLMPMAELDTYYTGRVARLCQQAQYMAGRLPHSLRYCGTSARRTASRIFHRDFCAINAALPRTWNPRRA
jgi:glycosyltransferase involved in cell wall biosynthesis